jgi:hypothetical protein
MTAFKISLVMPRFVRGIHGSGLHRTFLAENEVPLAFPAHAVPGTLADPYPLPVPPA